MHSSSTTDTITIALPDGSQRELPSGSTGLDLAAAISEGLARMAVAVQVDGITQDIRTTLADGDQVRILTSRDAEALPVLRHSVSHLLAEAVTSLYPGTLVTIGPAIDSGFYYDFEFADDVTINDEALAAIEAELRRIVKQGRAWTRWQMPRDEAIEHFDKLGERFKVELIRDLPADEAISFYQQGEFVDLCRGPHVQSTKVMKANAIKLTSIAGAYWRGDAQRDQLTRIYGTAFFSKDALDEHLANIERAKLNDHRLLGTKLDLFSFDPVSPGSPFWHPNGLAIWNSITDMWRSEHRARGYDEVKTPILYDPQLWKKSGHWDTYRENMFLTKPDADGRQFGLKPMNCPAHATIIKTRRLSWRDLPVRMNEQGLVHRFEASGVLHGLMRVRHITQDDAHIFCSHDQVLDEVTSVLQFVLDLYRMFGFSNYTMELSTRPEKSIGSAELWEQAEAALAEALVRNGIPYTVNEGDGAFYGPKIDFHILDSMGRSWQCGTIQLDYSTASAERFNLTYTGEDNADHQIVMIHRALLGSMERFIGILLEHYGGEFPLWLAPHQVAVLSIADRHADWAHDVAQQMRERGIRVDLDVRGESVGRKVRDAEQQRIPVIVVIGDAEVEQRQVSVRRRAVEQQSSSSIDDLTRELLQEIHERTIGPHVKI